MTKKIEYLQLSKLKKLQGNPRTIKNADFEILKQSIKNNPDYFEARPLILSNRTGELVIIAGNQRYEAARALGLDQVPTFLLENLTEEREREIIIRDNVSNGEWDIDALHADWDLEYLKEWGVQIPEWSADTTEYQKFVDKFKPKLTTDDCYTPPKVFEAVEKWVRQRYDLDDLETIRPFKPNGDYKAEDYEGKVVIDNPPFSIESEIVRYYMDRGIKFFMWGPHLTLLNCCTEQKIARIICGVNTTYENGAVVPTSFVTNLEPANVRLVMSYDLYKAMEDAQPRDSADLAKYERPKNCKTVSDLIVVIKAQQNRVFTDDDCVLIKDLDNLKSIGKGLYGGGVLLSDQAADKVAADKVAAEKIAIKVDLSIREKDIVRCLNGEHYDD